MATSLGALSLDGGSALIALGATAVVLLALVVFQALRNAGARARRLTEARELVAALEEIRSGHVGTHVRLLPGSELGLVGDAVERLGRHLAEHAETDETPAERKRALGDAAEEVAVVVTDMDGDVRAFSRGAAALFGHDPQQVLGRPSALLFEDNAYRDFLPKLARRSLREGGIQTRSTLRRGDGTTFAAELTLRGARPGGFVMLVRDATEQVRLEAELRQSEERYRGLVEGLADGVAIVQGGEVRYANPAFQAIAGLSARELEGRALRDLIATEDLLPIESALHEAERGEGPAELAGSLLDASGVPLARVRFRIGPIAHEGRAAALVLARDETREGRLARALQRNEARLDAVLEASPDGMLVLTGEGAAEMVQMTNRSFAAAFGLSEGELLGCGRERLLHRLRGAGEGAARLAEVLARDAAGPQRESLPLDGREVELAVLPLGGPDGRRLGRLVSCRDRTEQRRSESHLQEFAERLQLSQEELQRSYGRLEELNRDLEARARRLENLNVELRRLNQMKSDLLANVAHELQTPLVSIRGYTEMILKGRLGPIGEEQRRGLTTSLTNIDRLIAMIDGLLTFSRSETELGRLNLTRFGLGALLREVADLLSPRFAAREIRLVDQVERELMVYADREKIFRVFVNLLTNAVKFNRPGGQVTVSAREGSGDRILVRVEDTGQGIPRDKLDRIFDRHYRVETVEGGPAGEGSGIGLAIVRDILRLHGCRIHAESEEGKGTTFSFNLPLAGAEDDSPADTDASSEPEDAGSAGAPRRVEARPPRGGHGNSPD